MNLKTAFDYLVDVQTVYKVVYTPYETNERLRKCV